MKLKLLLFTIAVSLLAGAIAGAGAVVPRTFIKTDEDNPSSGSAFSLSKSVSDIWTDSDGVIWIATNAGLGRSDDNGETWTSFSEEQGLSGNNCNVIWAEGDEIWVQIIEVNDGYFGLGLNYSSDGGSTWQVFGKDDGLPTEGNQELAWDILKDDDGVVWVMLWNGGVGRSEDNGANWEIIKPLDREGHPAEHFYSIDKKDDLIWLAAQILYEDPDNPGYYLGSTGGFKSVDNGETWLYYDANQGLGIGDGGDFFPVVDIQQGPLGEDYVWFGSAPPTLSGEGTGVYLSRNGGDTWDNYNTDDGMAGNSIYGLGNGDGYFYAGSRSFGVSRTSSFGNDWSFYQVDPDFNSTANRIDSMSVDNQHRIWVGTGEGLFISEDNAETWYWIDYERRTSFADVPPIIGFPNPFNPFSLGGYNTMTFRYSLQKDADITLEIRDFAGRLVTKVVDGEKRSRGEVIEEDWQGTRDDGTFVGNGVYFCILKTNDEFAATGKFMVIK